MAANGLFQSKAYTSLDQTDRHKVAKNFFIENYTSTPEYKKLNQEQRNTVYNNFLKENNANFTAGSTFGHLAAKAAAPLVASIPAMTAGGQLGAEIGTVAGPIGTAVGGVIGTVGGAILGSTAANYAQDKALEAMPTVAKKIGLDKESVALMRQQHPTAALLGELTPQMLTFKPSVGAIKNAFSSTAGKTAEQTAEIIGNRMGVAGGATLGGAMEGYNQYQQEELNPTNLLLATASGALFNKENALGARISKATSRATDRLLGKTTPLAAPEHLTDTPVVPEQVAEQNRILQEQAAQQEAQARGEQPVQQQPTPEQPIDTRSANYMSPEMKAKVEQYNAVHEAPVEEARAEANTKQDILDTEVNNIFKQQEAERLATEEASAKSKTSAEAQAEQYKARNEAPIEEAKAEAIAQEASMIDEIKGIHKQAEIDAENRKLQQAQKATRLAEERVKAEQSQQAKVELANRQNEQRLAEEKLNELTSNSKSPLAHTGGEVQTVAKGQAEVPLAKAFVADKLNSHINEVMANNPEVTSKELVDSIRQVAKENNYDKESVDNAIAHAKNIQQYAKESSAYSNKANEISGKIEALANTIGMKAEDLSTTLAKASDDTLKESFGAKSDFSKEFKKTNKDGSLYGQIKKLQKEVNKFNETKEPKLPETSQAELHKAAVESYRQQEIDTIRSINKVDEAQAKKLSDSINPCV